MHTQCAHIFLLVAAHQATKAPTKFKNVNEAIEDMSERIRSLQRALAKATRGAKKWEIQFEVDTRRAVLAKARSAAEQVGFVSSCLIV